MKRLEKSSRARNLGDGEAAGEGDDLGEGEFAEPFALPPDLCAVFVHDFEELLHVGAGVLLGPARAESICRVADWPLGSPIWRSSANDEE